MRDDFLDKNGNMNMNFIYPTTMFEGVLAQMNVYLVLFTILLSTMKSFKAKFGKIFFY